LPTVGFYGGVLQIIQRKKAENDLSNSPDIFKTCDKAVKVVLLLYLSVYTNR
jgi:hypothetical protein